MEAEISLREIIETLLEGKWLIAGITAAMMIISGVLSFFIMAPTYEAEATIMVNQIQENEPGFLDAYVNEMVSPTIYAERLMAPALIKRVIEDEGLTTTGWTAAELRRALQIKADKETGLVNIKLEGNNPNEVSDIVNSVVKHSTAYTGERISEKIKALQDEYKAQMQTEQQKLNEAIDEYNRLKAGSGLPSLVLFEESVSEGSQFVIQANKEILDELQHIDKAKHVEFQQISAKIKKLTELYNSYNTKYEEARSISAFGLAKNKINPIVEAVPPINPVSPKKMLNIAIGTVVGLMLGVFAAFFRAYWRNSAAVEGNSKINRKQSGKDPLI
ncbi:Wzz/FepE/Etk N-terminal domain-containing protein [Schinkia azotoformans]|uniref:GumC family protein n=1 Tax=Schinkia azotoformans TaxID=1454 RepID=UPI002E1C7866|nr:Wzz/FepE/Etk N-terminal domain-containing protein [Schinkia azotoformans]MED4351117.1 Wzz/FepE/Etk N-terminal domain-containing protein [Schinkia azotoformans]